MLAAHHMKTAYTKGVLEAVTFTGADDSVAAKELAVISAQHEKVEWGILFSQRHEGPRFPSRAWLEQLQEVAGTSSLKLCAHLCGGWVRDLAIKGDFSFRDTQWWGMFERVQVNFHAEEHGNLNALRSVLREGTDLKPFILQVDGVHDKAIRALVEDFPSLVSPLFDLSGGAGVLPRQWPQAWPGVTCGYAGGLGPSNLAEQLLRIRVASRMQRYWIDMERKLRSADDLQFDLQAVAKVIKVVAEAEVKATRD